MAKILVSEIILRVREAADMRDSQFYSDAEITRIIERKYNKLWRKMVLQNESFFVTELTGTGVGAGSVSFDSEGRLNFHQTILAVAFDVWKHIDIEVGPVGGTTRSLKRVEYKDRYRHGYGAGGTGDPLFYYIHQNFLYTIPAAPTSTHLRWAVVTLPVPDTRTLLTTDTIDFWAGWEDVVVNDTCAALWNAQEWDPSYFMMEVQDGTQAILESMKPRDMGEARRVPRSADAQPWSDESELGW